MICFHGIYSKYISNLQIKDVEEEIVEGFMKAGKDQDKDQEQDQDKNKK